MGNAGRFEQIVMPHLDPAYNLARWLVRNPPDAQDIVQESYLRLQILLRISRRGRARLAPDNCAQHESFISGQESPDRTGGGIRRKDSHGLRDDKDARSVVKEHADEA